MNRIKLLSMSKPYTADKSLASSRSHFPQSRPVLKFISWIALGILLNWAGAVSAQETQGEIQTETQTENSAPAPTQQSTPDRPAPPELSAVLANIDAAASQGDLATVMSFYDSTFTNSDGLTYDTLQQALENFWQRYPNLTYSTQLNSWSNDGTAILAETTTTITGTQSNQENPVNLTATITSQQRFVGTKIVEQQILAEESQLTQGSNPPNVAISLPEQVTIGQDFEFDAIVQEPLGDRLLLGAAIDEQVQPSAYLTPTAVNLELLSSGGLFKIGQAPSAAETHWISATLIRDDGITTITRRLQFVDGE